MFISSNDEKSFEISLMVAVVDSIIGRFGINWIQISLTVSFQHRFVGILWNKKPYQQCCMIDPHACPHCPSLAKSFELGLVRLLHTPDRFDWLLVFSSISGPFLISCFPYRIANHPSHNQLRGITILGFKIENLRLPNDDIFLLRVKIGLNNT